MLNFGHGTILKYIGATFVLFAIIQLIKNRINVRFSNKIIISPLLMIVLAYISMFWSIDIDATIKMNNTYLFIQLMFIFTFLLSFNYREQYLLKKSILFGGLAVSIYVLAFSPEVLYNSSGGRIALNNADPNEFAALLMLPLFVSFNEIFTYKSKWNVILFGLLLYMILLTGSRGAILSVGFGILVYLFGNFKFSNLLKLMFVGILLFYFISPVLPDFIFKRFVEHGGVLNTIEAGGGRTEIWDYIFLKIIPEFNIWGYGSGTSSVLTKDYFGYAKGIHNTYLLIFLEFGVIGLIIFFIFLWKILERIKKENNYAKLCSFIAILIIIFFLDSYFKKYFWNILMFCVISNKFNIIEAHVTKLKHSYVK
jgi:O-antigen ligase